MDLAETEDTAVETPPVVVEEVVGSGAGAALEAIEAGADPAVAIEAVAPPPEPVKEKPKGPSDSLIGELTAQRAKRREAESKAQELEKRLADAQAILDRLSAKEGQPAAPRATPAPQNVNDEVSRQVALRLYERDIAGVVDRGQREFGAADFNAASQRFAEGVGDGTVTLAREIMDIAGEKSHKVIYDLSQDLDRALALRDMPPTRRILAINEMANMAESKTTAEPKSPLSATAPKSGSVSKAPPPAPAIRASTTTEKPRGWWWSDKTPDDVFFAELDKSMKERRGMRR